MIIHFTHRPNLEHLAEVKTQMQSMGSPTIRVVDCGDHYIALEGMHRLRAACELNITVTLDILGQDDLVAADALDIQDLQPSESYSAGELASEMYHTGCGTYEIDDNGLLMLVNEAAY